MGAATVHRTVSNRVCARWSCQPVVALPLFLFDVTYARLDAKLAFAVYPIFHRVTPHICPCEKLTIYACASLTSVFGTCCIKPVISRFVALSARGYWPARPRHGQCRGGGILRASASERH